MDFPKDLKYTKTHEWIRQSGDTIVIGVTAFAVSSDQLGDITLVEFKDVDEHIDAEDTFGTIESVKSVSDLYSPISGTLTKINEELDDAPELVNESPYDKGWLVEMKIDDSKALDSLLDADAYEALIKS